MVMPCHSEHRWSQVGAMYASDICQFRDSRPNVHIDVLFSSGRRERQAIQHLHEVGTQISVNVPYTVSQSQAGLAITTQAKEQLWLRLIIMGDSREFQRRAEL